jgi:cytochrome c
VTPKFISPSDPAAQWTGAHKGHAFFSYVTNYLIDTDHGVIFDVEATRAIRQAEVGAARMAASRALFSRIEIASNSLRCARCHLDGSAGSQPTTSLP